MEFYMMMKSNRRIYIISLLVLALILIPVFFYSFQFHSSPLSDATSDWGSFGSYYGGIVSPLSSICSTLLLIYITLILDKKNSKDAHNTKILEIQRNHFFQIVEKLQSFNDWLCAKHRYEVELLEAKRKYERLLHGDKDKIGCKEYLVKLDLCHQFIYNDYIKLIALNYYIQGLNDKYKYIFDSMDSIVEYVQLKQEFETFTEQIKKAIIDGNMTLPDNEDKMKQVLQDFIVVIQAKLCLSSS